MNPVMVQLAAAWKSYADAISPPRPPPVVPPIGADGVVQAATFLYRCRRCDVHGTFRRGELASCWCCDLGDDLAKR